MNFLRSLTVSPVVVSRLAVVVKAAAVLVVPFGIPMVMIYAFWKCNQRPKERVLTLEEVYPDEHLGV